MNTEQEIINIKKDIKDLKDKFNKFLKSTKQQLLTINKKQKYDNNVY